MPAADVVRGEAFIEQLAGRMMGQQAQTKAKGQLMKYKSRPREIGITPAAVAATQTAGVAPETFWTDISHSCAELSEVARMLLSIPPSSATSERVFSAVSQVWDTGRSCMASARVRKLLFIYFNRKALSRDGAVRDAEDFAAYVKWLDSLNNEEEQEKQQQQQQQQQEQQ
uniref:HAT C-terminal dimerisation domain-containing protein n=1 Tax=Tetradesmus obliquus TaxID=3088 RepID=A0A383W273_TETOB